LAQESDLGHAQSHVANNETNAMGDAAYDISDSGIVEYDQDVQECDDDIDLAFAVPAATNNKERYTYECRIEEYIMQGIEDLSICNENEDNVDAENVSNVNRYEGGNDEFTIESEQPFFPLPPIAHDVNARIQQSIMETTLTVPTDSTHVDKMEPIFAPLSMFEFHRPFSNEEFFMIKLCSLCDKANVPHHIVDDIVDLLRECQRNEIYIQPEQLRKRVHFLKHLENHFKSPIPQSIVIGLEGFSSNDIQYNRGLWDTAEIIWYDFREQALDLIHDVKIWSNLENFKGTIDPKDPFSGKPPRTDGLIDEVVDGAWYKRTYEECKAIAGDEDFLILGVILYCDKTGTDVYQRAGLEPMSFTFTIFNRECWYRSESWRVLGYVPDLEMKSTAYKAKQRLGLIGKGRPCWNYHTCLRQILYSLKKIKERMNL